MDLSPESGVCPDRNRFAFLLQYTRQCEDVVQDSIANGFAHRWLSIGWHVAPGAGSCLFGRGLGTQGEDLEVELFVNRFALLIKDVIPDEAGM
jgi:hypothetical protein